MDATVMALCVSAQKGVAKEAVERVTLRVDHGVDGDAHAGPWHRQVSLLGFETVAAFDTTGRLRPGAFGENVLIKGLDPTTLPLGTRLQVGPAVLETTQIGKTCHSRCAIYDAMGDCIMPRHGVFARVVRGGDVVTGDEIRIVSGEPSARHSVAVVVASDRVSRGEAEDKTVVEVKARLALLPFSVTTSCIVPDDITAIANALRNAVAGGARLVMTTGGTGLSPRDVTPEATRLVIEREAPGIAEAIRAKSLAITKRAMLSRAIAGLVQSSLIINLPGSPKAVREGLDAIADQLVHAIDMMDGGGHSHTSASMRQGTETDSLL